MSYRTLMVHVDEGSGAAARVAFACALAERFGAGLIGVAGTTLRLPLADPYTTGGLAIEFLRQEGERADACLRKAEAVFRETTAQHDLSRGWRAGLASPAGLIAHEARAADLIVVSRPGSEPAVHAGLDPGDVVMTAGRPVLVLPPAPDKGGIPSGVVIAWKDSREARRAVVDALPFLRLAAKVSVVEFCEDRETEDALRRVQDVAQFLALHGIAANPVAMPAASGAVAYRLIAYAGEVQAGLIVVGGYGHARLREWAFGGVTRALLGASPISCLFSH